MRARWLWLCLSALWTGCLRPLPAPEVLPCRSDHLAAFWDCLHRTAPVRSDCDARSDAGCFRLESSFRSTTRIHFQDVVTLRKWREQRPCFACSNVPPSGFVSRTIAIDGEDVQGFVHEPRTPGLPFILISYGLYDSTGSRYVRMISAALASQGFGVVVPDMRWHGCRLHDNPRLVSTLGTAEGLELLAWGQWIRNSYPGRSVALLGFSLGAQNVIHALALRGADDVFAGGVAVSPPADLERTMDRLDEPGSFRADGPSRLVRIFFRSNLAARLRVLDLVPSPHPFKQYVDYVATEEHRSADGFIESVAPEKQLALVRRPLLLIVSIGDPVFPVTVPQALVAATRGNPYTFVLETNFGGHIGHMGVAPKWFASVLDTFYSTLRGTE